MGAVAFAAVGAAALGAGVKSALAAADFQKAMAEVGTLSDDAQKGLAGLSEGMLKLARTTGADATASVKGLYQAISAGVPSDNAMTFMEVASKAAIGGVTDTETAVDGLTTVLNAFKIPATDVGRVADVMFTAVKQGKTDFAQLSQAMFNVAPLAASLGVRFEEVAAATATLTKSGTPTSVAMTQMRAAMQGVIRDTPELTAIFKKAGQESGQMALKNLGLQKTLAIVQAATGGNVGELSKLLGSVEAVSATLGVTGANAAVFAGDLDAMTNSAGASEKAFQQMSGTTSQQMAILQSTLNTLMIEVGSKILPAITPLITAFAQLLPPALAAVEAKIADLQPVFDQVGETMRSIGAVVGPMLGQAFAFLQENSEAAGFALKAVLIPILAAVAITAGTAALGIIAAMAPVVIPLAAIGAAAFLLYKVWNENMGGIRTTTEGIVGFLSGAFQTIVAAVETLWKTAQAIWVQFTENPPRMIGLMIGSVIGFFMTLPTRIDQTLRDALGAVGRFKDDAVVAFQDFVRDNGKAIGDFLTGLPAKFWDGAVAAVQGLIGGLGSMAGAALKAVQDLFGGIVSGVKSSLGIQSPSRVFEQSGANMLRGLEVGLKAPVAMGGLAGLNAIAGGGGFGGAAAQRPIILQLDGRVLAEVVGERTQQRSFLSGGALG